jgi:transcriptional regulator
MYVPEAFAVTDRDLLAEVMRDFPFATLVTGGSVPAATHLPLIFEPNHSPFGKLKGHLARANPQWRCFAEGTEALVIFHGPHAFVSPRWYAHHPAVPTWNYVAVHAYGRASVIPGGPDLANLVDELTARFEGGAGPDVADSEPAYRDRMLNGIVGFEIAITRLEGKFKLSQNRPPEDVAGVIAALGSSAEPGDRQTAEWMRRFSQGR